MSRSVVDTTLWMQYDYQNVTIDNWSSSFTEMHTIYSDQAHQTDNKVAVSAGVLGPRMDNHQYLKY